MITVYPLKQDLKRTLDSKEATEYLDRMLSGMLGIESNDSGDKSIDTTARVIPEGDAVDYSTFEELAEDQQPNAMHTSRITQQGPVGLMKRSSRNMDDDEDYDEDEGATQASLFRSAAEKERKAREAGMVVDSKKFTAEQLEERFPGYSKGKLKFSEIFATRMPRQVRRLRAEPPKKRKWC